jgi:hypothetical protein
VLSEKSPLCFLLDLQTVWAVWKLASDLEVPSFVFKAEKVKATNAPVFSSQQHFLIGSVSPESSQSFSEFIRQ